MFDITSSKLLLLGIVALIVIGPKDLPVLLRTLGKYVGIIRRQAAEFRAQFEEAVRESELDQLKKDVESMGAEAEASMREAERTVTTELDTAKAEVESATNVSLLDKPADVPADPMAHNANGLPIADGTKIASAEGAASSSEQSSSGGPEHGSAANLEHGSAVTTSLNGAGQHAEPVAHAEAKPKPEVAATDERVGAQLRGDVEQKAGA
jgi:sec-independent protein translocase protein TatB